VRALTDHSGGDRVLLDDQFLQLPVVVGEGCAHSLDSIDVAGQSIDGHRPADLLGDELAQLVEAVLVAAGEVALVQGGHVSAFESHVGHGHTVKCWCTPPAASDQGGDDRAVIAVRAGPGRWRAQGRAEPAGGRVQAGRQGADDRRRYASMRAALIYQYTTRERDRVIANSLDVLREGRTGRTARSGHGEGTGVG
jgi:hypothetical protein